MIPPKFSMRLGVVLLVAGFVLTTGSLARAQFTLTNLVTTTQDKHLKNGWGMDYLPGGPFWISDNDPGLSTVYDASGIIQPIVVTIPSATAGRKGSPTGLAANSTSGFIVTQNNVSGPASFIYDTLDGTISGWSQTVNANNAVIAVNNHATASYTGLAIATVGTSTFLYAANVTANDIEIYDSTFKLVKTFTDTHLTGMKVYGVAVLGGKVYVTFMGGGKGAVDIFTTAGKFVKTLVHSTTTLKGPWGLAIAPSNFDTLSGALLVGNVNNGQINGFNLTTGMLIGPVKDKSNNVITIPGLWALLFGGGSTSNGNTNQLFFAAGTANYSTGAFGVINP
jgi:uncharacterized protein (TIGR03118 family)